MAHDGVVRRTKDGAIDWTHQDVDIERVGAKITLPNEPGPMPIPAAIEALKRKQADEEQIYNVHEILDVFPYDGAVAFVKAMQRKYGWTSPVPTPGFFGDKPPEMLTVKIGPNNRDTIQVPHGSFKLPNVENLITTHISRGPNGRPIYVIVGEVRKRERHIVMELVALAREILATESIYKGKAIRIHVDDDGDLELSQPPEFLDVSDISEADLILNDDVRRQIEVSVLTPMRETEACRKHKIPLRRGVLLSGPYGTGKTLTARLAARVAQESGWTFVMLDKVQGLREALEFANRYAPAAVFAEDIDRVMEERDEDANDLINTIDGIISKTAEVMTVLTTNHVERIEKAMLRPGRLDAVITVLPPDVGTVKRLIHWFSRGLVDRDADLEAVAEALAGQIPATIREVVERSKLGMISRGDQSINPDDLLTAARSMQIHLNLLNGPKHNEGDTPAERLWNALQSLVRVEEVKADIENARDRVRSRIASAEHSVETRLRNTTQKLSLENEAIKKDTDVIRRRVG